MTSMLAMRYGQKAENDGNENKRNYPSSHYVNGGYTAKLHQQLTIGKVQYTKTYGGS